MMQADDPTAAFARPPPSRQASPPAAAPPPQPVRPPPATPANAGAPAHNGGASELPYPLYDVVLDLPHPGSSSSPSPPIGIFYPPKDGGGCVDSLPSHELENEFGPENDGGPPLPGAAKVARFAFPEYNDAANAQELAGWQATKAKLGWDESNSGNLNKNDGYLEGIYSISGVGNAASSAGGGEAGAAGNAAGTAASTGTINYGGMVSTNTTPISLPSYHAFSHRLSDGATVHGHVRRYLPYHKDSNGTRRDVGRRSVRALVVLTRNEGGGCRLYGAVLKSLEVLLLKGGDSGKHENDAGGGPSQGLRDFLHSLHREHVNLCRSVSNAVSERKPKVLSRPWILTLPLVELGRGHGLFGSVDTVKYAVPPSFLHGRGRTVGSGPSRNDLMPMLRCLGVPRTMRLLSALMSERRVILTSSDVSKLSAVPYGAAAMAGQGLLGAPSVFVPVLPPGLQSLLSTPSAYLIGVLTGPTPNYVNLRGVQNIGEVVLFDLDNQQGNEPYFHNVQNPGTTVPDLTRRNVDDMDVASARMVSIADVLYQELTECVKADKKLFWQGAVQEKLGAAAAKGKKAASAAMKKGLKYLKSKSQKSSREFDSERTERSESGGAEGDNNDDQEEESGDQQGEASGGVGSLSKLVGKGNYSYEQGYSSEKSEMDARVAFTTFFVSLYGDITTYMTQQAPGQPPVPDKPKFFKYRQANGDTPGSGMFQLVNNFLRSGLFDSFAAARLAEVQMRRPVSEDAPLFSLVANHHRLNKIGFSIDSVRQSTRHIAANECATRYLADWNARLRDKVTTMTSTQAFNGDWSKAAAQLAEDCRECTALLSDAMMVLWTRLREGRGMQWKKSLLALQIIRCLLLNGPINAVAEAIDGFASARILKSYAEAMRAQNSKLVRDVASEVYSLIVDPTALFARRRAAMDGLRAARDPRPSPLRKETRMVRGISQFRNIHVALRPAGAAVAPAPAPVADLLNQGTAAPPGPGSAAVPASAPQSGNYSNDLLSMNVAAVPSPQAAPSANTSAPQSGNYSNDLLALSFGASPSQQAAAPSASDKTAAAGADQKAKAPDPFSMQGISQAMPSAGPPAAASNNAPASRPAAVQTTSVQTAPQPTGANPPFAMPGPASAPFASQPPSQPMQQLAQQKSSRNVMNQPPFAMQPKQGAQLQHPPPMNSSFITMNNAPAVPTSQPMQQQQMQPPTAKGPVMNPPPVMAQPTQGGPFPYQTPPQQQPWNTPAGGFAPNGYQAGRPTLPMQNAANVPGGNPAMRQSQFQQGNSMGQNPYPPVSGVQPQNANMQKKQ